MQMHMTMKQHSIWMRWYIWFTCCGGLKMEGFKTRTYPLTLWVLKVSGKIVLASLCTLDSASASLLQNFEWAWTALEHFPDHFTLNKTRFFRYLKQSLHWIPSLPSILNGLRIANFLGFWFHPLQRWVRKNIPASTGPFKQHFLSIVFQCCQNIDHICGPFLHCLKNNVYTRCFVCHIFTNFSIVISEQYSKIITWSLKLESVINLVFLQVYV